ncbi:MAG: TIGR02186 family protein, partial [Cypionkella sp.]
MKWAALIFALICTPATAQEKLVTGVSRDNVQITADFTGSDILVYGAVQRTSPAPEGQPLDVIVTLEGPSSQVVVRRKEKWFGIWINRRAVQLNDVPSYFAIASSKPLGQILSPDDDIRYDISLERRINVTRMSADSMDFPLYIAALRRIRTGSGD